MKITKKSVVNSSTTDVEVVKPEEETVQLDSNREEAIGYIQSAISALSVTAKTDIVAKESIANLSVVLLDLK